MNLWNIPALDQHAHNLLKPEAAVRYPFAAAFSERREEVVLSGQARQTLFYRRSLRDLAELLNCEPREEAVLARRSELGLEKLTALCFGAAKLDGVFLDDGFLEDDILPLDWHRQFVPVRRLLRLEALAQNVFPVARGFDDFLERFSGQLDPPPLDVVAFKSIAAYRSGLNIQPVTRNQAAAAFNAVAAANQGKSIRLADKTLIDYLLDRALEIAAKHELPVQWHTGFGDPDLDLRLANPLHLRCVLEDPRFRKVPMVLLHASYPFTREAGYLASVYPQVYVDMGLAVPSLSVSGMRSTVAMLLEMSPLDKVFYSSDAHLIPELFFLAAKWGRTVLAEVLERAVRDSELTTVEAERAAWGILRDNARALYSRLGR